VTNKIWKRNTISSFFCYSRIAHNLKIIEGLIFHAGSSSIAGHEQFHQCLYKSFISVLVTSFWFSEITIFFSKTFLMFHVVADRPVILYRFEKSWPIHLNTRKSFFPLKRLKQIIYLIKQKTLVYDKKIFYNLYFLLFLLKCP